MTPLAETTLLAAHASKDKVSWFATKVRLTATARALSAMVRAGLVTVLLSLPSCDGLDCAGSSRAAFSVALRDAETGAPVCNGTILIESVTSPFCRSDACNDECEFFLQPGTYVIEATAPGYLPVQTKAKTAHHGECDFVETKRVIIEMTPAP